MYPNRKVIYLNGETSSCDIPQRMLRDKKLEEEANIIQVEFECKSAMVQHLALHHDRNSNLKFKVGS